MTPESKPSTACPHANSCALFPILEASAALDYWAQAYCKSEFPRCARFNRMREGHPVPPNLLPNGKQI
jgi:hypothetical protein